MDTADVVSIDPGIAFGGRLGITPIEMIEIGGSYAGIMNTDNEIDQGLIGIDLQLNIAALSVKGEYIMHTLGSEEDADIPNHQSMTNSGLYVQGAYDFSKFFLVGRYGMFTPDIEDTDSISRISAGAGWKISDNCQVRFEYQMNDESQKSYWWMSFEKKNEMLYLLKGEVR